MSRQLVHPRMLPRLTNSFFPHNVAFQRDTGTINSSGQQIENWTYVAGLTAVPCRIAPISTEQERKLAEYVVSGADAIVVIVGAYDGRLTTGMRLIGSDGQVFDVLAVEIDSIHVLTRCIVRTLRPA